MVTAVSCTTRPGEAPATVSVSSPSITVSSIGVRMKLSLPLLCPAAMVTVKPATVS